MQGWWKGSQGVEVDSRAQIHRRTKVDDFHAATGGNKDVLRLHLQVREPPRRKKTAERRLQPLLQASGTAGRLPRE